MSEAQSADLAAPIWCIACNVSSEGSTYIAFIHEHADCRKTPEGNAR